jgi:hypothetical protein
MLGAGQTPVGELAGAVERARQPTLQIGKLVEIVQRLLVLGEISPRQGALGRGQEHALGLHPHSARMARSKSGRMVSSSSCAGCDPPC